MKWCTGKLKRKNVRVADFAPNCCWANLIGVDPTSIFRPSKNRKSSEHHLEQSYFYQIAHLSSTELSPYYSLHSFEHVSFNSRSPQIDRLLFGEASYLPILSALALDLTEIRQ